MTYPSSAIIAATNIDTDEAKWLECRTSDITSTESSALFNCSPYMTKFELYHTKKMNLDSTFKATERTEAGKILEPAIAQIIAKQNNWVIEPLKDYLRLPGERIGSSFDYVILNHPDGPAHLEIKNVDYFIFKDQWSVEDGEIEAPPHIEFQVQHQMMVTGFKHSYIGVFVGGNTAKIIYRERDDRVIGMIRSEIAKFWHDYENNIEPPVIMPDDADAVIRLNSYAQPNKLVDMTSDDELHTLLTQYKDAANRASVAEDEKKIAKAEIMKHIGDAEKVIANGFSISAGMVSPTPATLITPEMIGTEIGSRSGFRNLRITAKKPKTN